MAEKNSGKPQLGDRLTKAGRTTIVSNGIHDLQMTSLDHTACQGGRRIERRKGWEALSHR